MPEIDDIDVLQKELENRNFITETKDMVNRIHGQNSPQMKQMQLQAVRQKLEYANNPFAQQRIETEPDQVDNFFTDPDQESVQKTNVKGDMLGNLESLKDDYLL